jgi:chromosome segregation and condensation protein ScpB
VAALNNVELITALISFNCQLGLVGLQLRILNGVVSLLTTRVESKALAAYVSEQSDESGSLQLTTASLEVLACIAFKQPISQAEIDQLFDADKRGLVVKLRDLKLVEEFAGADGRLRFATTQAFLQRSGLESLQDLTAISLATNRSAMEPLIWSLASLASSRFPRAIMAIIIQMFKSVSGFSMIEVGFRAPAPALIPGLLRRFAVVLCSERILRIV